MKIEMRAGEQRVGVAPHWVKGDVAQIQQPGEADDDVQTEREQDVKDGEIGDPHPRGPGVGERERQRDQSGCNEGGADPNLCRKLHARSPTRSPSRPEGRNTSTTMRTRNANTSW